VNRFHDPILTLSAPADAFEIMIRWVVYALVFNGSDHEEIFSKPLAMNVSTWPICVSTSVNVAPPSVDPAITQLSGMEAVTLLTHNRLYDVRTNAEGAVISSQAPGTDTPLTSVDKIPFAMPVPTS
jgi:hypothetical protein